MRIACIICGKDFKTRHDLERHNVVHTGTRSFTCTNIATNHSRKQALLGGMKSIILEKSIFLVSTVTKLFWKQDNWSIIWEFILNRSQNLSASSVKNISKQAKFWKYTVWFTQEKGLFHANNATNHSHKKALLGGKKSIILGKDHFPVSTVAKLLWKNSNWSITWEFIRSKSQSLATHVVNLSKMHIPLDNIRMFIQVKDV